MEYLQQGDGKGSTQQFKYHRDGGGCRHTERIEHVEQYHVGNHDSQEYTHHVVEREILWRHDAMSGHVHHTVAQGSSDEHANSSYRHHSSVSCHPGSDSRVQKVYGIIAYANHQVEHCKHYKEYNYS